MTDTIEISVNGQWIEVPALQCKRDTLIVSGKWARVAEVHDEAWQEQEVEDPELCIQRLKERSAADLFTFTHKPPSQEARYRYYHEPESNAVVLLSTFPQWWESLPQETRKNVRRAEKRGVTVLEKPFDDELVKELVEINNSSQLRQRRKYRHYGKSFEEVKRDYCSFADRSDFLCAYAGGEMIGFIKVVYRGDMASVLNLTVKEAHYDKRPANILLSKAVERCTEKKMSCLTYGLYNYGNRRDTPLSVFKHRHGFREMLIPRYYVPLSTWGRIWVGLRLHRGVLGIVPNRVLVQILSLRAMWYRVWK